MLTDPDSFPTDLYITQAACRDAGATLELVHPSEAVSRIAALGDELVLASYSSVALRTGGAWGGAGGVGRRGGHVSGGGVGHGRCLQREFVMAVSGQRPQGFWQPLGSEQRQQVS